MPKPLPPERQQELEQLHRQCSAFADHLGRLLPAAEGVPLTEAVDHAHQQRSVSGLRMARNDFLAWTHAFTGAQLRQLNEVLRARAGVTLDDLRTRQLRRIWNVRRRGKINTEEQYYLVRERIEEISDDPARGEETSDLQSLLHTYETNLTAR